MIAVPLLLTRYLEVQARLRPSGKTKYRSLKHILPTQYMRSVNVYASNTA